MIQSRAPGSSAFDRLATMISRPAPGAAPIARPSRIAMAAACAALALAGCAQEQLSPGLEITILPATIATRRWVLPRVDSAAQEKYAEGATALYLDGDIAMLESDGRVLAANCRSTVALPRAPSLRPYVF